MVAALYHDDGAITCVATSFSLDAYAVLGMAAAFYLDANVIYSVAAATLSLVIKDLHVLAALLLDVNVMTLVLHCLLMLMPWHSFFWMHKPSIAHGYSIVPGC
jgi:hypothetical protein